MEIAELKKLQEQARDVARSIEASVHEGVAGVKSGIDSTAAALTSTGDGGSVDASGSGSSGASDYSWEASADTWESRRFQRRYRPGPSVDELSEEIAKLKRQLALPETATAGRRKYSPRARINRPRIRR
jgi:sec-independent protein translocase protein TatB